MVGRYVRAKQEVHMDHDKRQVEAQVEQAFNDNDYLQGVARHIHVEDKGDQIVLEGQVATAKQADLATNTANAIGIDEKVINNRLKVAAKKK